MTKRNLGLIVWMFLVFFLLMIGTSISYAEGTADTLDTDSYDSYIKQFGQAAQPDTELTIPAASFAQTDRNAEVLDNFEGHAGKSVKIDDTGFIEWKIHVQTQGLYQIGIDYFPIEGKGSPIVRSLEIDGKQPFDEAHNLTFSRNWANETAITRDSRGNDVRPSQTEKPVWMETLFNDSSGYSRAPFRFYFSEGDHTIRLVSVKEPMVIGDLKLVPIKEAKPYQEIAKQYAAAGYSNTKDVMVKIQGEDALYKSDPMMYPIFDRSSPATEPFDPAKIRLNTIGADKWQMPGQWLTWEFEVPEDGLYKIGIKARQALASGSSSSRKLMIDGNVPFREMESISFDYNTSWNMYTLGKDGNPYLFYLTKGKHEIKLEVTFGSMADVIRKVQDSVFQLGAAYRGILMITGGSPDPFRDYEFPKQIPDTLKLLKEESGKLSAVSKEIQTIAGQKGGNTAIIDRLAIQAQEMADNPDTIAKRLETFKGNIGALGTWIMTARQQPLEIDYMVVASPEEAMPKAEKGFFAKLVYLVESFFASFTQNYDTLGDTKSTNREVTVWIGSGLTGGRDQAQILKQMIDNYFTPNTGIAVNLKLVSMGALLPATIAGKGPDVALQLGAEEPINFAVRNAAADLTQFPDFREVADRFHPSALVPFTFEGRVYGLPETQTFPIMFYRKDILKELQIQVPETWDDVIDILPVLQKKQMTFGMPVPIAEQAIGAGMTSFATFLFQDNGNFYKKDGIASDLDSDQAIDVFGKWTGLYTNYKLPLQYDFANRFRIGEVPIGIADYSMYNMLSVFAPEIDGLWGFALVPGTKLPDGTINRSVPGGGNATVLMKQAKDKEAAWQFMKWWTSSETQVRFGKEMESLLGPAARYPTANLKAIEQLPWSQGDFQKLQQQWKWVQGIPQVPGGYYTPRYVDFAFRKVVYNLEDPGEVLSDYVKEINKEINVKRKEFGLRIIGDE